MVCLTLLTALSLFFSEKRETEKPLVAASSPIAIGFTLFVHFVPENDKLPTVRQCHFLYGTPFSTLASADATKVEQVVTHLLMLKLRFNPCLYSLIEMTIGVAEALLS